MIRLTGSQNPLVKEVRALKSKSGREEKGRYFIEGVRFVEEALKENARIRYLMVSETFSAVHASSDFYKLVTGRVNDCYLLPDSLFGSISDTQNPQGILAVLDMERKQLDSAGLQDGVLLLLDGVKDPGNMGTIIRTADAAGCAGVILPEGCVDVYNPKVLRSTMGSLFHIPLYHCRDMEEAIRNVRDKGFKLCVSYLEGSKNLYEADLKGPVAIVIGNEADGVGREAMNHADLLVRIPMEGRAESLNASVAAAIILYEAVRQRNYK